MIFSEPNNSEHKRIKCKKMNNSREEKKTDTVFTFEIVTKYTY